MLDRIKSLFRPDNIPLVMAILLSFGFLVYDLFRSTADLAPQVIVAVLGILAAGLLAERLGYLDRMEKKLTDLSNGRKAFLRTPIDWIDFENYLYSAEDIFISGGSLRALTHRYKQEFAQLAKNGRRFRFVLLNPSSPALPAIAAWADVPPERFRRDVEDTLADLTDILHECGPIFEVRLNNSVPALTVLGFNTAKQDGRIRVDLNLYKCHPPRRVYFELTWSPHNSKEDETYRGFLSQFDKLWSESEKWTG